MVPVERETPCSGYISSVSTIRCTCLLGSWCNRRSGACPRVEIMKNPSMVDTLGSLLYFTSRSLLLLLALHVNANDLILSSNCWTRSLILQDLWDGVGAKEVVCWFKDILQGRSNGYVSMVYLNILCFMSFLSNSIFQLSLSISIIC